jgi:hypothetical protein
VTSPRKIGTDKTRGKVASKLFVRIRRSDEEVEIYRGADHVRRTRGCQQLGVSEATFYSRAEKYGNVPEPSAAHGHHRGSRHEFTSQSLDEVALEAYSVT